MAFNELNSVAHYIINNLSGVNLNNGGVAEPGQTYGKWWKYKSAEELKRNVNEVLNEEELKGALVRLNPEIKARPELADEVIYNLYKNEGKEGMYNPILCERYI